MNGNKIMVFPLFCSRKICNNLLLDVPSYFEEGASMHDNDCAWKRIGRQRGLLAPLSQKFSRILGGTSGCTTR